MGSAVSGKTTALVTNETDSNSAKAKTAKKLKVKIITEQDLIKYLQSNK